jgi:polyhydroxybutyrate depolymerase
MRSGDLILGGPLSRFPAALWFAAMILSALCPVRLTGAAAPERVEMQLGDTARTARVYPGAESDRRPSPLVIVFHGLADSAWNFAGIVAFHEEWPEATVVYPEGLPREDRAGRRGWHGFRDNDINQDMAFTDLLLETLADRYLVDPSRVYVTGFSNGGHMTFNLLVDRPCRFAAFAPIGALGEYVSDADTPRPVIYLFGREEPREYSDEWQKTVVALARINRATGEKREWAPGLTEFLPGPGGQPTVYGLYGAGHVWPSGGNELIVRFFREHRLDESCGSRPPDESRPR